MLEHPRVLRRQVEWMAPQELTGGAWSRLLLNGGGDAAFTQPICF